MRIIEIKIYTEILQRLDSYLSKELVDISRTEIQRLIKDGYILVNGKPQRSKYLLKAKDNIKIKIPISEKHEILPQKISLDIIYQDEDIAIVNKPQGMTVHPAPGNYKDTLVNALLYNLNELSDIAGEIRQGIVHRLDKDTSGLLIIAKNNFSHKFLSESLKQRNIKREYITLVKGNVQRDSGVIDAPIGRNPRDRKKMAVIYKNSKPAITYYEVVKRFSKYTLVKAKLETGRTHQIRVHLSHIKHPIVGDLVYSNKNEFNLDGQLLHSYILGFTHPRTGKYMEFCTDIPKQFNDIIEKLRQ